MGGSVLAVWYALYSDLWSPCWIDGRKPYPFSFREWLLTPYFTCCSRGSLYPPLTGRYLRSTHSSRKSAFPSPIANLLLEQRRAVSRTTHFQSIRPDLPYLDNSHSLIISFTSAISDITYGVQHLILLPQNLLELVFRSVHLLPLLWSDLTLLRLDTHDPGPIYNHI